MLLQVNEITDEGRLRTAIKRWKAERRACYILGSKLALCDDRNEFVEIQADKVYHEYSVAVTRVDIYMSIRENSDLAEAFLNLVQEEGAYDLLS